MSAVRDIVGETGRGGIGIGDGREPGHGIVGERRLVAVGVGDCNVQFPIKE